MYDTDGVQEQHKTYEIPDSLHVDENSVWN